MSVGEAALVEARSPTVAPCHRLLRLLDHRAHGCLHDHAPRLQVVELVECGRHHLLKPGELRRHVLNAGELLRHGLHGGLEVVD